MDGSTLGRMVDISWESQGRSTQALLCHSLRSAAYLKTVIKLCVVGATSFTMRNAYSVISGVCFLQHIRERAHDLGEELREKAKQTPHWPWSLPWGSISGP